MGFQFPLGFKFSPTDFELIYYYLLNKQTGKPLPMEGFVKDCDLYNEHQVLELFTMMNNQNIKKLYFFTCLKKKSDKGSRIDRTVGQKGTWKGLDSGKKILDKHGRHVGCKKTLDYENKGFKDYGAWKMKEYSLDGVLLKQSDLKFKDIVLCQIKMKDRGSKRARRDINVHQEQGAVTLFNKTEDEALVNYGCLYNKRIRASEGCNQHIEHLPVQSIARTPAASDGLLSRETQWHQTAVVAIGSTSTMLPSGNYVYDLIPMACAPPLKEAAPTVEQSSFSMGENDVRMLQQPSMIQKPALESAMQNVGCENAIETPQGLRALDENVDYSDFPEVLEDILKDANISAVLASQTHWQNGDGVVTDTLGTLPSCSPVCDVSDTLLASMPSLKGIKPAPTVVTNAAISEENEVKHLEQPTTSYDPAPRPDMTNGGSEDKILTPGSDLHELSLDKYDDATDDEHQNWVEVFADNLLKDQQLPLQESEIQMLPNTSYSYGLHGLLGGGFLLPSQLKTK